MLDTNPLPGYLKVVVTLQGDNGKWVSSNQLHEALGGYIPNPPKEISQDRWTTTLVMVFLRRYPEYIEELKDTYKKGLEWTSPKALEIGKEMLPPRDAYYELDETLVKDGKWKDSVEKSFQLGGYQYFLPTKLKVKREEEKNRIAEEGFLLDRLEKEEEEIARLAEVGVEVNDKKLSASYRKAQRLEDDLMRLRESKMKSIEVKRQPLLNVEYQRLTKTKDFGELKKRWESTCTISEEMKRLKVVEKEKNYRKPWADRNQAVVAAVAKRQDLGQIGQAKEKRGGPSPLALAAKEKAMAAIALRRDKKKKKLSELDKALQTVDKSNGFRYQAAEDHEILKRQLDCAQAEVITCTMAYEDYILLLKEKLKTSVHAYRAARVVSVRQSSFDELTAMLGHPLPARVGFNDWKGKPVPGMMEITCYLIESVVKWRECVLAAQGKLGQRNEYGDLIDHGNPLPFTWNGKNILLEISYGLHFLSSCKELVGWYGNDFTFERNPFMLAVPLDERPQTPIKDTREIVLNGAKIEQVSESLAKIARKQRAYQQRCEKVTSEGGSWWPAEGGKAAPPALFRRVKSCEKVLLLEEALYYFNKRTLAKADADEEEEGAVVSD